MDNEHNVVRTYQEYQNGYGEKAYNNIINIKSIIKRTINNKKQKVEEEEEGHVHTAVRYTSRATVRNASRTRETRTFSLFLFTK